MGVLGCVSVFGVLSILRSHLCCAHEPVALMETVPLSLWYGFFINLPVRDPGLYVFLFKDTFFKGTY